MREEQEVQEMPGIRQRSAGLKVKMMGLVLVPMVVIALFSVLAIRSVGSRTAVSLAEAELKTAQYLIDRNLKGLGTDDMSLTNGQLMKGNLIVSGENGLLASYHEGTGVDVTVFLGSSVAASTIPGVDQNTAVDGKIIDKALKGETVFKSSVKLNGREYMAYFAPLTAVENSNIQGVLMTAISANDAKGLYGRAVTSNIIFMVILVAIFAAETVAFVALIVNALLSVVENLGEIAEGSLALKIPDRLLNRNDEVGKIAGGIQNLVSNFSSTIANMHKSIKEMNECTSQFGQSFDSITQSIDNVNIAVNEIAEGATQQAADTQNVGSSMNSMSEAINKTTANVNELNGSAATMQKNNELVDVTLKELIDISRRTIQSVDEVQKQTNLTNESAQAIRSATEIITGIASQTNLLSLNASIEAARAGEMGRGFAVVAEEIRGLADQSKESADQIRSIVETLIQNSDHSVEIMGGVVNEIHQQNDKLGLTQNAFKSLKEEVLHVVKAIQSISSQVDNIENYKNGVVQSVDGLAEISQNNAASTEETAATMDQLAEIVAECKGATAELIKISEELTENARRFKL